MMAAKILEEQGIEVCPVCFVSNFYNCQKAKESAKSLNLELKIIDITKDMLSLVKNPPNGYGKNMNPCIDCHGMMIKKAGEMMNAWECDILATGEVLGQRPFSQNKKALMRVSELAQVEVLRPLSAKELPPTKYEENGLVVRGRLRAVKGRSRERQMELAKKYGINTYPSPAGGCLLTDPEFSTRLMKMLDCCPDCTNDDVELLKNGRVYWLKTDKGKNVLMVIGRDHNENIELQKLKNPKDFLLELSGINGPTTLIRGLREENIKSGESDIDIPEFLKFSELKLAFPKCECAIIRAAAILTGYYSTKARGKKVKVKIYK